MAAAGLEAGKATVTCTVTMQVARSPSVSRACKVTVPSDCVCASIASSCGRWSASVTVTLALAVAPGAMLAGAVRPIVIAAGPFSVSEPVIVCPSGAIDQKMSGPARTEEHTSELQSLMRNSYDVFCLKKKNNTIQRDQSTRKEQS